MSKYAVEKPRFEKEEEVYQSKPLRMNSDFKGWLPLNQGENKYLLTNIDEYSHFLFVNTCRNILATTILTYQAPADQLNM